MFLMSTSMVLCENLIFYNRSTRQKSLHSDNLLNIVVQLNGGRKRFGVLIPNAKKIHSGKRSWWQKFFFDDDGNWFGLKDDDMLEEEESGSSSEEELSEGEKFEAWKRRAEAIIELREAQEDLSNEENRRWEDWLVDGTNGINGSPWGQDWGDDGLGKSREDARADPGEMIPEKGLVESMRDLVLGKEDDDMLYEDRVFRYASLNSECETQLRRSNIRAVIGVCVLGANVSNTSTNPSPVKFLALLIIIPWALDFLVHDYVLMPFLDRYVKTVPLAAEMLDVRREQKLEMVKDLKIVKARFRLEVEIGKSPPLSDDEVWLELRNKALELRDEWRLENRRAFANIWSDMVFGISLFILLYFNQNKVALLKFTGNKIINNISDTGKAFLIILITDIFLGYHSESGWQTLLEIIVEHYGLEVDQAAITIFISLVPVVIDACVKLWLFKFLPRISPKVANIFREMKRH